MTIPDPTLYGPPTVFQWARETLKRIADDMARDRQAIAKPMLTRLDLFPDDRHTKERLVELERTYRRDLDFLAAPYMEILHAEPMPTMFLVKPDGTIEPIDERVPLMGPTPP